MGIEDLKDERASEESSNIGDIPKLHRPTLQKFILERFPIFATVDKIISRSFASLPIFLPMKVSAFMKVHIFFVPDNHYLNFTARNMAQPQITGSQVDFQDFTSLPDTADNDDVDEGDNADEVQDSGMDVGIDSGSDDDADDDMIVLDPEHVSEIKLNSSVDMEFLTPINI